MAKAHKTTGPEVREPSEMDARTRERGRFQEAFPVSNNDIIGHMAGVEPCLQLLRDYSGIPADQIEAHVRAVRDKAFAIYPYPCIGSWRFLDLYLCLSPSYPALLSQVRDAGAAFVDVGCCFGQVLRQLAADGCPADRLAGVDLRGDFIDLGFELFRDRDRAFGRGARFAVGSMLEPDDPGLRAVDGSADIIHAASFFHLWGWDDQVRAGVRMVRFFRSPAGPGITQMVVGRQLGEHAPLPREEQAAGEIPRFRHNPETWQMLWDEIGRKTDTEWKVEAKLKDFGIPQSDGSVEMKACLLFEVRKVP